MEIILDHLFFVNNELKLKDVDQFFEKIGFQNTVKEASILSYVSNDSNDLDGVSWYIINVDNGKILNSSFRTTKEINLEPVLQHVEKHHGFTFDEETEDSLIYKRGDVQMHVRTVKTLSAVSKPTYVFYLFNSSQNLAQVTMTPPPTT